MMDPAAGRVAHAEADMQLPFESLAETIVGEIEGLRGVGVCERLGRLLDLVLDSVDAEIGSIMMVTADARMRMAAARGLPPEIIREVRIEIGEGISGHVARTGDGLLVRNVETDDRFRRRNRERYHSPSFVSAPLLVGRSVRGVVNVSNKCDRTWFDHSELEFVERIGGQLARIVPIPDLGQWCCASVRSGTPPSD